MWNSTNRPKTTPVKAITCLHAKFDGLGRTGSLAPLMGAISCRSGSVRIVIAAPLLVADPFVSLKGIDLYARPMRSTGGMAKADAASRVAVLGYACRECYPLLALCHGGATAPASRDLRCLAAITG